MIIAGRVARPEKGSTMYSDLREFIGTLEREGELVRIGARVDPVLEIAEITDRVSKSPGGGKALLFENTGTRFPVLTNMLGSERRINLAMGVASLDEIPVRIETLFGKAMAPRPGLRDKLRLLPVLGDAVRWMPKVSGRRGECQQVVCEGDDVDLGMLPVLRCWPHDGGRFVTLPMVHTVDPQTGARNVGMYRMQIFSRNTTGMHWHTHKTGARHYEKYRETGGIMPVSVCLGGDPVYTYSAAAPMPEGMDEYLLAGFLRGRPVKLVKCLTNDIYVPSDCDVVIEGYVDPAEPKVAEGPFGDHTGFYSLEDLYPVFHATAVTHRRDAVYPATLVGIPPQEDLYVARATEKIFIAPIRLALQPEVKDLWMPAEGTAHNLAVVNMRADYEGQAFKVASALWGAGQMMFNKLMLLASTTSCVRDDGVLAPLLRNADMESDVMFSRGPLDVLDHAAATPGVGGKMMIDLTRPRAHREISLPEEVSLPAGATADLSLAEKWGVAVVRGCSGGELLSHNDIKGVNYVVEADPGTGGLPYPDLLWYCAANVDPGRDIRIADGVMLIDARAKTPPADGYPARWPNAVASSRETVAIVDRRWNEYGLGEPLASPSLGYMPLLLSDGAEV